MLNHEPLRLADGEYRFACLVWDNEPLPSGQLVALAAEIRALLDAARYKEE